MKYRLNTLLLLVALVMVSIGWIADSRRLRVRLADETRKVETQAENERNLQVRRQDQLSSVVHAISSRNEVYRKLSGMTHEAFSSWRTRELMGQVILLYEQRSTADDYDHLVRGLPPIDYPFDGLPGRNYGIFNALAAETLELLGVQSTEQFRDLLNRQIQLEQDGQPSEFIGRIWDAQVSDEDGNLEGEFLKFLEECLAN